MRTTHAGEACARFSLLRDCHSEGSTTRREQSGERGVGLESRHDAAWLTMPDQFRCSMRPRSSGGVTSRNETNACSRSAVRSSACRLESRLLLRLLAMVAINAAAVIPPSSRKNMCPVIEEKSDRRNFTARLPQRPVHSLHCERS